MIIENEMIRFLNVCYSLLFYYHMLIECKLFNKIQCFYLKFEKFVSYLCDEKISNQLVYSIVILNILQIAIAVL